MFYTYYKSTNGIFYLRENKIKCFTLIIHLHAVPEGCYLNLNVLHLLYIYKWHIWSSQEAECMGAMWFHKGAIFYLRESNSFQLVSSLYYFRLIRKDRDKKYLKIRSSRKEGKTVGLVYENYCKMLSYLYQ